LLLCTDGLHGYVLDPEIAGILSHPDPQVATLQLIAAANARGGPDNITVIVADITEEDFL
jgi:protein phosphatase